MPVLVTKLVGCTLSTLDAPMLKPYRTKLVFTRVLERLTAILQFGERQRVNKVTSGMGKEMKGVYVFDKLQK
eukprot:m.175203 g.175203  ORF g.175203 m.175203 type:complete len:72 (-) comp31804_c0_seq2:112-327(-)